MNQQPIQAWPNMNHNSNGNMVSMTNPESELKRIEKMLRGDKETNLDPLMNEKGVNKIMGLIRSIVNRNTFMSNIKKDVLFALMQGHALTVVKILMTNKLEFDIKSDADRSAIFQLAVTVPHIAILRGLEGDDKRFWKGNVQEFNYQVNGAGEGMMSKMNPFTR